MDRKPALPMESRDERITVRLTPTELARFRGHAFIAGEEVSRYIRRCALLGDSLRQHIPELQGTGG